MLWVGDKQGNGRGRTQFSRWVIRDRGWQILQYQDATKQQPLTRRVSNNVSSHTTLLPPRLFVQPRQLMIGQRFEWSVSSAPLATQSSQALAIHRYSLLGEIRRFGCQRDVFSYDEYEENIRRAVRYDESRRPSSTSLLTGACSRIYQVRFNIIFFLGRAGMSKGQLSHLVEDKTLPGSDWSDRLMSLRLQGSRRMTHGGYDNNNNNAADT